MIIEINPKSPSRPIKSRSSEIFLYISPTNGASGPKIIPNRSATETNGTRTLVNLVKKSLIELKNVL